MSVALFFSFAENPTATNGTAGRSAKSKRGSGKLLEANRRYQRAWIECLTCRTSIGKQIGASGLAGQTTSMSLPSARVHCDPVPGC